MAEQCHWWEHGDSKNQRKLVGLVSVNIRPDLGGKERLTPIIKYRTIWPTKHLRYWPACSVKMVGYWPQVLLCVFLWTDNFFFWDQRGKYWAGRMGSQSGHNIRSISPARGFPHISKTNYCKILITRTEKAMTYSTCRTGRSIGAEVCTVRCSDLETRSPQVFTAATTIKWLVPGIQSSIMWLPWVSGSVISWV